MARGLDLELIAALTAQFRALKASFKTLSKQSGPPGVDGINGQDGAPGRDGADGKDGAPGRDGADGKDGVHGRDGVDGKDGATPKHEWSGSKLRFEQADGSWGEWVDLRGPKGATGKNGSSGGYSFSSGFNPDLLALAGAVPPTEFIVKQDGAWVRASLMQVQSWLTGEVPVNAVRVNGEVVTVNNEVVTWNT